jgi:hypothetical protein
MVEQMELLPHDQNEKGKTRSVGVSHSNQHVLTVDGGPITWIIDYGHH